MTQMRSDCRYTGSVLKLSGSKGFSHHHEDDVMVKPCAGNVCVSLVVDYLFGLVK